jgi:hypothetical protein
MIEIANEVDPPGFGLGTNGLRLGKDVAVAVVSRRPADVDDGLARDHLQANPHGVGLGGIERREPLRDLFLQNGSRRACSYQQ